MWVGKVSIYLSNFLGKNRYTIFFEYCYYGLSLFLSKITGYPEKTTSNSTEWKTISPKKALNTDKP